MTGQWRRFEDGRGDVTRFWQIRREGIRCFISWGHDGGPGGSQTTTLTDEDHARSHLDKKVGEQLRKGFAQVGHGALPYSDWARRPHPVIDLRFDVQSRRRDRDPTFKVYPRSRLDGLRRDLAGATPESWLEIRSWRGTVLRLTPADAQTTDLDRFLVD